MTFLEKYLKDYPGEPIDLNTMCPWHYYYEGITDCPGDEYERSMSCEDCWNREMQSNYWILVDGMTGVCPRCHRQDHIDPLAKYCRYCGVRIDLEDEE